MISRHSLARGNTEMTTNRRLIETPMFPTVLITRRITRHFHTPTRARTDEYSRMTGTRR